MERPIIMLNTSFIPSSLIPRTTYAASFLINTDNMPVFCRNQCANTKCAKHITKAYECGGSCSMRLLRGEPECAGYISRRKRK